MSIFEKKGVPEIKLSPEIHKHICPDSLVKVSAEKSTAFKLVFEYEGNHFELDNLYGLENAAPCVRLIGDYGGEYYAKLKTDARKKIHNEITGYINLNGIDLPQPKSPYDNQKMSEAIKKISANGGEITMNTNGTYSLDLERFMVRDGIVYHQTMAGTNNYYPHGFSNYSDPKILNFVSILNDGVDLQQDKREKTEEVRSVFEALSTVTAAASPEVYRDPSKAADYFQMVIREYGSSVSFLKKIFADLIRFGPEIVNNERKNGPQITEYSAYHIISFGNSIFKIEKNTGKLCCLQYTAYNPHTGYTSGLRTVMDYYPSWNEVKNIEIISGGVRNLGIAPVGSNPLNKLCNDIIGGLSAYTIEEGEYPMEPITND